MKYQQIVLLLLLLPTEVVSFLALQPRNILSDPTHTKKKSHHRPRSPLMRPNVIHLNGEASDDNNDDNNNNNNNSSESSFYADLRKAKKQKLGGAIPQDQLAASAADAENEFLKAMEDVGREFHEVKEELGSDAAIDLMMGRIQKEDEIREKEIAEVMNFDKMFEDDDDEDDDDDDEEEEEDK